MGDVLGVMLHYALHDSTYGGLLYAYSVNQHDLRYDLGMARGRSEEPPCDRCAGMAGSGTAPRSR